MTSMAMTESFSFVRPPRPVLLAAIAGLASAFVIGKALPPPLDAISSIDRAAMRQRECGVAARQGRGHHLACVAERTGQARHRGARVLRSRRLHAAASSLRFGDGLHHQGRNPLPARRWAGRNLPCRQSFFEPPGSTHMVSANASTTEPAELIAVFVADEGAQLTTMLE